MNESFSTAYNILRQRVHAGIDPPRYEWNDQFDYGTIMRHHQYRRHSYRHLRYSAVSLNQASVEFVEDLYEEDQCC